MSNLCDFTYGTNMTDEHRAATAIVTEHVARAERAIKAFRKQGTTRKGVLVQPLSQAASLKVTPEQMVERWFVKYAKVQMIPGSLCGDDSHGGSHMRMNIATSRKTLDVALTNLAGALTSSRARRPQA